MNRLKTDTFIGILIGLMFVIFGIGMIILHINALENQRKCVINGIPAPCWECGICDTKEAGK